MTSSLSKTSPLGPGPRSLEKTVPTNDTEGQGASAPQLPLSRKLAFGVSGMTDTIIQNTLVGVSLPIYNIALGLSPQLVGWALAIPRIMDAILDPMIGNASDNLRTRWGRRRPFMFIASFVMAFFFALIWMPPSTFRDLNVTGWLGLPMLFWFFMVVGIFYYISYAFWAIPRGALGIEMTTDPQDRTRLFAYMSFFAYIAGMLGVPWFYKLAFVFNPQDEIDGIRYVACIFGGILLVCSILPVFLCRERDEPTSQPKIAIWTTLRYTLTNGPFLILAGLVLIVQLGIYLSNPMGTYINIDYICGGNRDLGATYSGYSGTVTGIVSILSIPAVTMLSNRLGKRKTIIIGLSTSIVGFCVSWFTFTPSNPWLQMIPATIYCAGLTSIWVLGGPILADICDLDELKHGLRREGVFGAANQTLNKAGVGLITLISGYVITGAGYDGTHAIQSTATLTNLRIAFIAIPVACLLLGILLAWLLPITEASAQAVRAQLDARERSI